MEELTETVSESIEKAREHGGRDHALIALLVAITATFMALCNVKGGNVVQAMAQDQAKAVDAWSYYQAKGTKLNLAEAMLDQLSLQRSLLDATPTQATAAARTLLEQKIASYQKDVARYTKEKDEIKATAQGFEADYDHLNLRDDQFDMAEAMMSISLALFGITALTGKRSMFVCAIVFASIGVVMGISGFAGLSLHSALLARLLG